MNRLLMQGLYEGAHTKDEWIHVGINVFCAYAQGSRHEGRSCPRPNLRRSHRRRTTSSGSRRCSIHMTPCFLLMDLCKSWWLPTVLGAAWSVVLVGVLPGLLDTPSPLAANAIFYDSHSFWPLLHYSHNLPMHFPFPSGPYCTLYPIYLLRGRLSVPVPTDGVTSMVYLHYCDLSGNYLPDMFHTH